MSGPERLLADTSALIDRPHEEEDEAHGLSAAGWAISTMTIAELHMGVLVAPNDDLRAARVSRLADVEARYEALPLDIDAARALGRYMAEARRDRRALRVRDAIIAATAETNGLPVLTRDTDFQRFGASVILLGSSEADDAEPEAGGADPDANGSGADE